MAQTVRHPDGDSDLSALPEPAEMMADALRLAAEDSGAGQGLLERATGVRAVAPLSWRYRDPGALVATRVGASPAETLVTSTGGNSPQMLVDDTCLAIARGDHDVVLITGAEAMYTRRLARLDGHVRLPWSDDSSSLRARVIGDERPGSHPAEAARSLVAPANVYPVFENALRAAAGESVEDHQVRVSQLWSRFSEVAARNPFAWMSSALSPEEIRTPSAGNRMVSFPYPKLMTANIQTDQAAALVICSAEAASSTGVPRDKWVFPLAGAEANDHWFVSERADLHSSPAIRAAGRAALEAAGHTIGDVAHVDLYSCFPSAVQIAAPELGLGLDEPGRPLTVTGGLGFAGGPGSNYATHSIAAMVEILRDDAGSLGLVSALGWYATEHAIGLYSTEPPPSGFRWASPQREVDALPSREVVADHEGAVTVESYTVAYERDGSPSLGYLACLIPDGRRAWGEVRDPAALEEMVQREQCGRRAVLGSGGAAELV